ncbi:hypothetical protein ACNS7O_13140 [Haloferacaceae archaeon DSL9]
MAVAGTLGLGIGTNVLADGHDIPVSIVDVDVITEVVTLQNDGDGDIDLSGYVIDWEYEGDQNQSDELPEGTIIQAGGELTIASGFTSQGAPVPEDADVLYDYGAGRINDDGGDTIALHAPGQSDVVDTFETSGDESGGSGGSSGSDEGDGGGDFETEEETTEAEEEDDVEAEEETDDGDDESDGEDHDGAESEDESDDAEAETAGDDHDDTEGDDHDEATASHDGPTAVITTSPANAAGTVHDEGASVRLCATDSHADAGVSVYNWDTNGDGSYDATGSSVSVDLDFCGSVEVTLCVSDENGAMDSASVTLRTE